LAFLLVFYILRHSTEDQHLYFSVVCDEAKILWLCHFLGHLLKELHLYYTLI